VTAEVRQALADLDAAFDCGDLAAVRDLCTEDIVFIVQAKTRS
jgi:ketosteroid isomerase-like protein